MDLWVNMKFMKADVVGDRGASTPAVTLRPTDGRIFSMPCRLHTVDNPRETILALCLPRRVHLALEFDLHQPVRRVLVGKAEQPFQSLDGRLIVHLAARDEECRTGAEIIGYISRPGLQVFVNLPDPLRAAGAYSGGLPGRFPEMTLAMEFALRRAALALGLDRSVGLSPVGPLNIMGFDTNDPQGHTDAPPHVHIHPAGPCHGAAITHYYYGDDGRFDRNCVVWRNVDGPRRVLGRGETFEHRAPDGTLLYATEITGDGGLRITAPSGAQAVATPDGAESSGVTLSSGGVDIRFEARIDIDDGRLVVEEDGQAEYHGFDTDTGRYLGPQTAQAGG